LWAIWFSDVPSETPVLEEAFEWLAQCRETGAQREEILRCAQDDLGARITRGSG
jgi:hypothetical protein